MNFWISDWICGFQIGFLPTVYETSFVVDPSISTHHTFKLNRLIVNLSSWPMYHSLINTDSNILAQKKRPGKFSPDPSLPGQKGLGFRRFQTPSYYVPHSLCKLKCWSVWQVAVLQARPTSKVSLACETRQVVA